ncbi:glyoxylase-like metal-dependent hydrolase (beta-lactamase superfamily II) [Sphingomonas jinjuensis]|uniref:Glyoxylase-like metal-dependent hydrolase (Beta-lactamase superfamily II) n=1 Tax=Sphingomonas jinjuensis TaxID=535907 RepID=A0A840FFJ4_9SPHN|nr:MBL fold metallo-hydrolase [Sphingomonas jinjuensis]MBB4152135.1 glyoxylase-like metal-dependent hydrolase (beta-lactamase superfamily II) [Sphingomonas jinjuensis]
MVDASQQPPLRAAIVPVTPLQQNCSIVWCTATMKAAVVDPGGDIDKIQDAIRRAGVTVEKILLTHGHIDHAGEAKPLAEALGGVPIEGPHEADRFWLARLDEDGRNYGIRGVVFEPDRWLVEGDTVTIGDLVLNVYETPGHTEGHVIFHHPASSFALVGDVLFQGSVGRSDMPGGNHQVLIRSIVEKLWPLGPQTAFIPGHGPASTFAHERAHNMFVSDRALAA